MPSRLARARVVRMERPAPIRNPWITRRVGALHNAEPHTKEPVMRKVRFIGLDVHADTIAVAIAEPSGDVRSVGVIPNRPESIRKLVKKLGPVAPLRVCYEAGPTGYVVYWQLTALGVPSPLPGSRSPCRWPSDPSQSQWPRPGRVGRPRFRPTLDWSLSSRGSHRLRRGRGFGDAVNELITAGGDGVTVTVVVSVSLALGPVAKRCSAKR